MRVTQIVYIGMAAILTYLDVSASIESFSFKSIILLIVVFIFYLVVLSFYILLGALIYALFSSGLKRGILCEHTFTFLDTHLIEETTYNKSIHNYNAISKVTTLFGTIYILFAGAHWHILPKRDFKNDKDREKLLTYLKEKIKTSS